MTPEPLRYAITDGTLVLGNEGLAALTAHARFLAAQRFDFLQLREKHLPAADLARAARALLAALHGSPTKLLINGRADIAIATGAPGVHLPSSPSELTPQQVHKLYAHAGCPAPLVTVSAHTLDDIARLRRLAAEAQITAILFGPVFEKSVAGEQVQNGTGLALLRQACLAAAPIPILALGGVTPANIPACLAAGAAGVAGIRLFHHPG